ncbi:hypothetical protein ACFW04_009960 [Cataglyphis niger]
MITMDPTPISSLACILLIVLSGVYVFILAIDLISQFAGSTLHFIPMCLFSIIGLAFFATAGILLILYSYVALIVHMAAIILCLLAALFFLLDITMVFVSWKKKCFLCKRCCYYGADNLLRKESLPPGATVMKHDVTTSLSDVRVPDERNIAEPDHSYRRTEYARRREYVDSSNCAPSLCRLNIAQIQTEPRETSVVEIQTPSRIVKETPIQTFAKCEFCQQIMQPTISDAAGQYLSYPAIVQFVRAGTDGTPCCPGCKCPTERNQQPLQKPSRPLSTSKREESPVPGPKSNKTSEATQQVTSKSDIQNCVNYPYHSGSKRKADIMEIKRDGNLISQPRQILTEEIIAMLAKNEEPAVIRDMIAQSFVGTIDKESTERKEKLIKGIEFDDKIERIKGGGGEEYQMKMYHQLMHASEEGHESSLKTSTTRTVGTQISETISPLASSGRTKSKIFLHLKPNKVDPIRDDKCAESPNSIERRMNDDYSRCKRQNLTPILTNYYNIFKDKRGRYMCKFCAPSDSKRITSRLEITDSKKLRCANCQLYFRVRGVKTSQNIKLKSNTCPKYDQSQRQTAASSPSSM